jgi:hypothetical protein
VDAQRYAIASSGLKRAVVRYSPVRLLFSNTAINEFRKKGELLKTATRTLKAEKGEFFTTLDNVVAGPVVGVLVKAAPVAYKKTNQISATVTKFEQSLQGEDS